MISLNILKPVSKFEKAIAKKCGWVNADSLPVRKNVLPDGFVSSVKLEHDIPAIGTKLNSNNAIVMELILGNDKLLRSPFVRSNMTAILDIAKSPEGSKVIQNILTPKNVDKLDTLRTFIKKRPAEYIKDKSQIKYINTPAGLNLLFNDVSMLKAAEVLDLDNLNLLFKLDVTQGIGKKLLDTVGEYDVSHLSLAEKDSFKNAVIGASSKN